MQCACTLTVRFAVFGQIDWCFCYILSFFSSLIFFQRNMKKERILCFRYITFPLNSSSKRKMYLSGKKIAPFSFHFVTFFLVHFLYFSWISRNNQLTCGLLSVFHSFLNTKYGKRCYFFFVIGVELKYKMCTKHALFI